MNVCLISSTKKEQHSTWWPNKKMTQVQLNASLAFINKTVDL